MSSFLPVFITRSAASGMPDSTMAIPAISHEHVLPAMGSQFPETGLLAVANRAQPARVVDGSCKSNRRSATALTTLIAELIERSVLRGVGPGHQWPCHEPDASGRQLGAQAGSGRPKPGVFHQLPVRAAFSGSYFGGKDGREGRRCSAPVDGDERGDGRR